MPVIDKAPSRPKFKVISPTALHPVRDELCRQYPNLGDVSQILANEIAIHYLGKAWYERYVLSASPHATYLGVNNNAAADKITAGILRYLEFAETLLNLQHMDGFEVVLDELSYGKIESACAELDIARMLACFGLEFQFIAPVRGARLNYDLEICYPDGLKVCAETAAKFEGTDPKAKSITTSLKDSRTQLPDNRPGVIFVKVPEHWVRDVELARQITNVANGYLNQSKHIMSVKFYSPITVCTSERTARWNM
jgi:hypothetical protein